MFFFRQSEVFKMKKLPPVKFLDCDPPGSRSLWAGVVKKMNPCVEVPSRKEANALIMTILRYGYKSKSRKMEDGAIRVWKLVA